MRLTIVFRNWGRLYVSPTVLADLYKDLQSSSRNISEVKLFKETQDKTLIEFGNNKTLDKLPKNWGGLICFVTIGKEGCPEYHARGLNLEECNSVHDVIVLFFKKLDVNTFCLTLI